MCYVLKKRIQVCVFKYVRVSKNKQTFISTFFEIQPSWNQIRSMFHFFSNDNRIFASTKISHSGFGI